MDLPLDVLSLEVTRFGILSTLLRDHNIRRSVAIPGITRNRCHTFSKIHSLIPMGTFTRKIPASDTCKRFRLLLCAFHKPHENPNPNFLSPVWEYQLCAHQLSAQWTMLGSNSSPTCDSTQSSYGTRCHLVYNGDVKSYIRYLPGKINHPSHRAGKLKKNDCKR